MGHCITHHTCSLHTSSCAITNRFILRSTLWTYCSVCFLHLRRQLTVQLPGYQHQAAISIRLSNRRPRSVRGISCCNRPFRSSKWLSALQLYLEDPSQGFTSSMPPSAYLKDTNNNSNVEGFSSDGRFQRGRGE
jgi:hypothetical protein